MIEDDRNANESLPVSELPSPLAPERYLSYSIQRKIIGFNVTGDTIVFKRNDFDATQLQTDAFYQAMVKGKINAEYFSKMLRFIPDGLGDDDRLARHSRLNLRLSQDEAMRQVMAELMGMANKDDLGPTDISRFLHYYPTPIESTPLVEEYTESVREDIKDPLIVYAYEEITRDILDSIYGERFSYFQNLKFMRDKAQSKASNKKPLRISEPSKSRKILKGAPKVALGTTIGLTTLWGGVNIATDIINDGQINGPLATTGEPRRGETEVENATEEKYGIEILDIREAYGRVRLPFNPYNTEQFGNRPPTRWEEDQIKLLDELLSDLPEYFYKPHDDKLEFTMTDYGEGCPCAGTFRENVPNILSALITLDYDSFQRSDRDRAFKLLTHELAHRVDIDLRERGLGNKAVDILGFETFEEARNHFMPILKEKHDGGDIDTNMHHELNYGFMGIKNEGLNRPSEFIAELAEIYVGGRGEFMGMASLFGEDKTNSFYEFMRDNVFEGREYAVSEEAESDSKPVIKHDKKTVKKTQKKKNDQ